MYVAYKIQIKPEHELFAYCDDICFKGKNLYNITNYYVRQVFIALKKQGNQEIHENQHSVLLDIQNHLETMNQVREKTHEKAKNKAELNNEPFDAEVKLFEAPTTERPYLNFGFMDALFKAMKQVDYLAMPSQANQQIMRKLFDDWKSFYKSIAEYIKNPAKFTGRPKMPKYKPKQGRTTCYLTSQIAKIKENQFLRFPGTKLQLNLGKIARTDGKLQQVRIVPEYGRFTIEVIFTSDSNSNEITRTKEQKNDFVFEPKRVMGIDLGVDNLATIVDNSGLKPLLIKGKWLKSINQYYNKNRARHMSALRNGKQKDEGLFSSKHLLSLDRKRNNRVTDALHKASAKVIKIAKERNIDTIIIGRNKGWKQESEMNKTNNQNFVQLPHAKFIEMVRYKAERIGIQVVDKEESYTSQSSFLNNDPIPVYGTAHDIKFSGYRETRSFYKLKGSIIRIHADVNGAFNIVRKHVPKAFESLNRKHFLQSPQKIKMINVKLKASA